MEKWFSNPTILWIIIIFMIIFLGLGMYYLYTRPNIGKVQAEVNAWKSKYEKIVAEYTISKQQYESSIQTLINQYEKVNNDYAKSKETYSKNLSSLTTKYNQLKLDYEKVKGEIKDVKKPTSKQERIDRLNRLGLHTVSVR